MNTSPQKLSRDEKGKEYNPALNQGNPELDILEGAVLEAEDKRKTAKQDRKKVRSALSPSIIVDSALQAELEQNQAIADEAGERLDMIARGEHVPGAEAELMHAHKPANVRRIDEIEAIADEAGDVIDRIGRGERVPGVESELMHAYKTPVAPERQQAIPDALVFNADRIANTLQEILGDQLKLTPGQLIKLSENYGRQKTWIHSTNEWFMLETELIAAMDAFNKREGIKHHPNDIVETAERITQEAIQKLAA